MHRTERLFQIIQVLRSRKTPITGRELADELEISLRTLYRDVTELMTQRIPIKGEAGTGYILEDGYDMPPLMLTADELEVAALGAAWVATQGDKSLAQGARHLVGKLSAAVPAELRPVILDPSTRPVSFKSKPEDSFDGRLLRRAIRERYKLSVSYEDKEGSFSTRVVWPLLIAYMDEVRLIVAWCEKREAFRHFRADRIKTLAIRDELYPYRRDLLLRKWEETRDQ